MRETDDQKQKKLVKRGITRYQETKDKKETRLAKIRESVTKRRAMIIIRHGNCSIPTMDQDQVLQNINYFHKSNEFLVQW